MNVNYLYEIEQNGKYLKKLDNYKQRTKIFFNSDKRRLQGKYHCSYIFLKDNRFYSNVEIITVPFTINARHHF